MFDVVELTNQPQDVVDAISFFEKVDTNFEVPVSLKVDIAGMVNKLLNYGKILAIYHDGNIVSALGFYCNDDITHIAHISILATEPMFYGKGLAKKVMTEGMLICKDEGMSAIRVDTVNSAAKQLYCSLGFTEMRVECENNIKKTFLQYYII